MVEETRDVNGDEAAAVRAPYRCHVLTIFPDFFASPLETSIMGRAVEAGQIEIALHDIRDATTDRHRSTDDTPYGGGAGMVMKPEPIVRSIEAVEADSGRLRRIYLTPQGRPFDQACAQRLAEEERGIMLLCGRYEGVDERVREHYIDEEISIGDYVLTGGEPAALIVLDAVARLLPGVLGNAASAEEESFQRPLLEYPQYTRPFDFRGHTVPEILTSGDHGRVATWRHQQSLLRTLERRPDLFARVAPRITSEERAFLEARAPEAWNQHISHGTATDNAGPSQGVKP